MDERHLKIITRYPAGFLSTLGVQSDGQAPNALSPEVGSVIDISPFMQATRYGIGGGATTASLAVGAQQTNTLNGPNPGEIWVVGSIAVHPSAVLGAGTTYTYQPCLFSRGQAIPLGTPVTATVGQQTASCIQADGQLILNPGDQIGVWVGASAGIAAAFQCTERVFAATF
jgi:hypothetical protein